MTTFLITDADSREVQDVTKVWEENDTKCPLAAKYNGDCDLIFFKDSLPRGVPCHCDGKCLGTPLRKVMHRKDNPERKVSMGQLNQAITKAIKEYYRSHDNSLFS